MVRCACIVDANAEKRRAGGGATANVAESHVQVVKERDTVFISFYS
jgi:hypothetical protein